MFSASLQIGQFGEQLYHRAYPEFERTDGLFSDFKDQYGRAIELKTDTYPISKTKNFFFERFSDEEKMTAGGPWRALECKTDFFVYMYVTDLVIYTFETKALVERLDSLINEIEPTHVRNPRFTTLGYRVPRDKVRDLAIKRCLTVSPSEDL